MLYVGLKYGAEPDEEPLGSVIGLLGVPRCYPEPKALVGGEGVEHSSDLDEVSNMVPCQSVELRGDEERSERQRPRPADQVFEVLG